MRSTLLTLIAGLLLSPLAGADVLTAEQLPGFTDEIMTKVGKGDFDGAFVAIKPLAIVDQGAPLGKTKRVSARGVADTRNEMAAYTVVEAESHEAAARLFENHPHFVIFPGEAIEVMECLPMPTK